MNQNALLADRSVAPDVGMLFRKLENATGVLAAVSGGSDSVAMLALLHQWHTLFPHIPVFCATVDHGLREGSDLDASHVAALCASFSIPHTTLCWNGIKPDTGIEKAARNARYRLLCAFAREHNLSHLVTAHTLDDQAETVLMRLAAGSGVRGLAGMRESITRDGVVHSRPLLGMSKKQLEDVAQAADLVWRHDPMNDDPRFARVRLRQSQAILAEEGLTAERLALLALRMERADHALEYYAIQFFEQHFDQEKERWQCRADLFFVLPPEIALRLLLRIAALAHSDAIYPRLERFETLYTALRAAYENNQPAARTLEHLKFAVKMYKKEAFLTVEQAPPRRSKKGA